MIKAIMLGFLLAAQSVAPDAAPPPASLAPAELAEALQTMVGRQYEGGMTIAGIAAEERTLVILLDGPAGWREALSPAQVSAIYIANFCEGLDWDYFGGGDTMRVDTTESGAALLHGPIIRQCH